MQYGRWMTKRFEWVLVGLALAVAGTCAGEGGPRSYDEIVGGADRNKRRKWFGAPDDWSVAGTALEDAGVSIGAEYIGEYSVVLDGGIREEASFRNLFTGDVTIDTESLVGLSGGTAFVQFLYVNAERGGSLDAGDIQVYSNLENDRSLAVIYEMWYEQRCCEDRVRIKLGKVDANSEFNVVEAAGGFSNSSAGFSPTIFVFPTYPDPAMSVNLFVTAIDTDNADLTLGYGLFDGAAGVDGVRTGTRGPSTFFQDDLSNDYFNVIEAALSWERLGRLSEGRLSIGSWRHTGEFARFDGGMDDDATGYYLTAEQRLMAPDGSDGDAGLHVFGQYGWADEQVSQVGNHIAGGLVCREFAPDRRPADEAGVYVTFADLSDVTGSGFSGDETTVDAYYQLEVTPAVYVQPELQWIKNPSGAAGVDDALVGGIRVNIVF